MLLLKTGSNFGDFSCFYGTHFGDSHQIHQIQLETRTKCFINADKI